MKRYFIILIALVVLFALPVFARTPTPENAPMPTLEDINTGNFILLNESEMDEIIGQVINSVEDWHLLGAVPGTTNPNIIFDIIFSGKNGSSSNSSTNNSNTSNDCGANTSTNSSSSSNDCGAGMK